MRPLQSLSLIAGTVFFVGCQALAPQQTLTREEYQQSSLEQQNRLLEGQVAQMRRLLASQQHLQDSLVEELNALRDWLSQQHEQRLVLLNQHSFQLEQLQQRTGPPNSFSSLREATSPAVVDQEGKLLLGRYEWIHLPDQSLVIPARVDSGANTSSLHAVNLVEFERDGSTWVRFETHYQPEEGATPQKTLIEAPLLRRVRILQASGSESRPVISLPIRLGSLSQETEFTLTDRGDMRFPALLGRRFMMDVALIDVSREFVQGRPEAIHDLEPQP